MEEQLDKYNQQNRKNKEEQGRPGRPVRPGRPRRPRDQEDQNDQPTKNTQISKNRKTVTTRMIRASVVDPKLFIPDPDPALNFPSSGSGSKSGSNLY